MELPTAKDMAKRILSLSDILIRNGLITSQSVMPLCRVAAHLKKYGNNCAWEYQIEQSEAIEFTHTRQDSSIEVTPRLYVAIDVCENDDEQPFNKLTTTLEVVDIARTPISRWHIDRANDGQDGPLFHLQGGGHWADGRINRENELPIKLPRWAFPPMDLILACEVIIANFFPAKWKEIRSERVWIELIKANQTFCYPVFYERLQKNRHSSHLQSMWSDEWQ